MVMTRKYAVSDSLLIHGTAYDVAQALDLHVHVYSSRGNNNDS